MMLCKHFVFVIGFMFIFHTSSVPGIKFNVPQQIREQENAYWLSLAKRDIDFAMRRKFNNNVPKNIIFFLGDGMGISVTTAGRIFKGQQKGYSGEEEFLLWEKFPNVGFSKTYNLDKQVADSAATATAFFAGVKANFQTLGVTGAVKKGECRASLREENRVTSILQWSQDAGKDTGIVTSTRVTHATPAALYAHSADRDWECDENMKNQTKYNVEGCKDIARQLIEDYPGKSVNVILAGGRRQMGASLPGDQNDCLRNDSRNLVNEWLTEKRNYGKSAEYVTNNMQLDRLDPQNLDFIMGLFSGSHMPYVYEKNSGPEGTPTLKKMTEVAIRRLQRNKNGFFLMVEGGRIDHGLHNSKPHVTFLELLEFEDAVKTALDMTSDDDTLIIVTADHSHVMTINGYPERGNDILGFSTHERIIDNMPYTTLMFTNGFGANYSWNGEKVVRTNLSNVDTRDFHFVSQAAVGTKAGDETHGGEDVGIFATGPMSHLFHRVHEQSYIGYAMAYAACVGPFKFDCDRENEIPMVEKSVAPPPGSYSGKHLEEESPRGQAGKVTLSLHCVIIVPLLSIVRNYVV